MARPRLAETRQRRDYRFSPATLHLIRDELETGTYANETAFVEAAIHRTRELEAENERLRARIQDLEREREEAALLSSRPAPVAAGASSSSSSAAKHQPTYQMYIRHEPGPCPDLPEGFSYIDEDRSKGNRRCMHPIHRVFAKQTTLRAAELRADDLLSVAAIVSVWIEDKTGQHSWRKESGHWRRQ